MTEPIYSRRRVEDVLTKTKLQPSCRIIPRRHFETPLGTTPGDSRFGTKADGFTVLYVSPDFDTAFVETVVRDRFARRGKREIRLVEVTERAWALITSKASKRVNLLDLRNDGCVRLGAPTDAVNARTHAAGRALARAIHAEHPDIDGFLWSSRLTAGDVYAVFNRAVGKLVATESGSLPDHPLLIDTLSKYRIKLTRGT